MKLLVIGSGGREHALAWKLASSPLVSEVFVAPGNPGIALEKKVQVDGAADFSSWLKLVKKESIEFVVVGPDQALADGVVDFFQKNGIACFGPTQAAARIESSKIFAKNLMKRAGIPTAEYFTFSSAPAADKFFSAHPWRDGWVVKADGLAFGKGVIVCEKKEEFSQALQELSQLSAGRQLVVEERLAGKEVSAFFLCDGERAVSLGFACDHKQLLDGGRGPNTGGMGAYSPVEWLPKDFTLTVERTIVKPLLEAMKEDEVPFHGILFIGLMLTSSGPKVLEFNARFGDPETQAIMPLLAEDLLPWLQAAAKGSLAAMPSCGPRRKEATAVHIVMAAEGYPGSQGKAIARGDKIDIDSVLLEAKESAPAKIFFAGVSRRENEFLTNGGRVLGLTSTGRDRSEARKIAYEQANNIQFRGRQMRRDIGV